MINNFSSLELEKSYLGGLLLWKTPYVNQLEDLFYTDSHKVVFNILKDNRNCDIVILKEKLGSRFEIYWGNDFLISLTEKAAFDLEKVGVVLNDLMIKRSLVNLNGNLNALLSDSSKSIDEVITIAQDWLTKAALAQADDSCKANTLGDLYENFLEMKEKYNTTSSGILGYATGFKLLDLYAEGLQRGTVTRINAYSNTGKTQVMIRILCNLLRAGRKCVLFSTEVRRDTFIQLLASAYYGKNKYQLYKGEYEINWEEFSKLPLFFYDSVDNLKTIRHLVSNHVSKSEVDVVFIDYAQNIIVDNTKDEYSAMTAYARWIQKMSIKHNIALCDLSQLSNEGAKAGSGTSGVISSKGSGALVAAADVAVVLERTEFDMEIKMSLGKNKYGKRTHSTLLCDFSTSSFEEHIDL